MKLVTGLGNPGRDYHATRHNAGFRWVERLAGSASFRLEPKFHGWVATLTFTEHETRLLLPNTYMNESGAAVSALARYYKIAPAEILIVHDELDLSPGDVRLKNGGGVAGHNGLKSVAAHLNTRDFWRLRLGIGHPGERGGVVHYVLHPARPEEEALIENAMSRALEVWPLIAAGRHEAAMMKLHTKSLRGEG
ncbi:MAG TPA: aminoacyl-tRNA hydrolase [Burkholderiales bacterium]|nr:aminoacyl-tRNA hydrolase [Burkholderiales bacterium]